MTDDELNDFKQHWTLVEPELTKREKFAMTAMQGIVGKASVHPDYIAEKAVGYADALIKELKK